MDEQWRKFYQQMADLAFEERVNMAVQSFDAVWAELKARKVPSDKAVAIVNMLIAVGVSGDRVTSAEEHELYNAIFQRNDDYELFYELTNGGAQETMIEMIDSIVDIMSEEGKQAACMLALCFISADGELTPAEIAVFEKLLA